MKDKIFFDSNLIVYAFVKNEQRKKDITTSLLYDEDIHIIISIQVVNEFANIMLYKKLMDTKHIPLIIEYICYYCEPMQVDEKTIILAIDLHLKYKYSYYDCLILASALENNCKQIYSEGMQHNQKIENKLLIVNPFKIL
jgi:predicted nucleic acid-binding protein